MRNKSFLWILLMTFLFSFPLSAQDVLLGFGVRGGATVDPDQGHLGVHFDLGEIGKRVRFQPNLEFGFGDNVTVLAVSPEFLYLFKRTGTWTPYAGGGLGLNYYTYDSGFWGDKDGDFKVGLNLVGGFETMVKNNTRVFFEGKFGVGDSPDFKVTAGITFLR